MTKTLKDFIYRSQTPHQKRIEEFMLKAKQEIPNNPIIPNETIRILRARLILEEALETIHALGCSITTEIYIGDGEHDNLNLTMKNISVISDRFPNLVEIADGCADLSVVTIGTLSACGIKDNPVLAAVDLNNLDKFGPGHYIREDGKLIKPEGHKPPNIKHILENMYE